MGKRTNLLGFGVSNGSSLGPPLRAAATAADSLTTEIFNDSSTLADKRSLVAELTEAEIIEMETINEFKFEAEGDGASNALHNPNHLCILEK